MNATNYDIAIVGSGPIGASSAYFLSQKKKAKILLITQDLLKADLRHEQTYMYAGGCVNYTYWPGNSLKAKMTKVTADFVKKLSKKGVDLSLLEDNYLFLDRGVYSPSLNVAGAKLVNYLLNQAEASRVKMQKNTILNKIDKKDGVYYLKTSSGDFQAKKVLLALGPSLSKFMPELKIELEKRVLLVLDVKVDDTNIHFPHTIVPLGDGWVYLFIKKIGEEYKMVMGQEDAVEHTHTYKEENYLKEVINMGLGEVMPFLKKAKVEKILWGYDPIKNDPTFYTKDNQLFAVYCGSAVRACAYIGQEVAKRLS